MPNPHDFIPMVGSVFASQNTESIINKQSVLSELGQEVKTMLARLPADIAQRILQEYKSPTPELLQAIATAMAEREMVDAKAVKEINLDKSWLAGTEQRGRGINEEVFGAVDEWANSPSGP